MMSCRVDKPTSGQSEDSWPEARRVCFRQDNLKVSSLGVLVILPSQIQDARISEGEHRARL